MTVLIDSKSRGLDHLSCILISVVGPKLWRRRSQVLRVCWSSAGVFLLLLTSYAEFAMYAVPLRHYHGELEGDRDESDAC